PRGTRPLFRGGWAPSRRAVVRRRAEGTGPFRPLPSPGRAPHASRRESGRVNGFLNGGWHEVSGEGGADHGWGERDGTERGDDLCSGRGARRRGRRSRARGAPGG